MKRACLLAVGGVCLLAWGLAACSPSGDGDALGGGPPPPAVGSAATGEQAGWWHGAVFYELFVRSFSDASSGPLAGDGIGDLAGLIQRLDYLNDGDPATDDDLGVTALWLMPVMESPSYHGYDVTDYYAVAEEYGTADEFRALIAAAHRRGVRVIVDLVLNHTSRRHPWFRSALDASSGYRDWYIWSYETLDYRGPWGQAVWHDVPWWRRGWRHLNYLTYYGIFSPAMPDLNYRNPEVTREARAIARFWIEEMGADGFRLDAVRHLIEEGIEQQDTEATHAWLRGFHRAVKEIDPAAVIVGEVWDDIDVVASYGPDELDLAFQFELASRVVDAVRYGSSAELRAAQVEAEALLPGGRYASFLSNHDQVRVMSQLDGSRQAAGLAASILLTSPGTPFLYYGEEIGMSGLKPDPNLRTPMQWTAGRWAGFSGRKPWYPVKPNYHRVNVETQSDDPDSLLSLYRRLIRLRQAHPALAAGDFTALATEPEAVYAFVRESEEERLLVIANLGEEPVARYRIAAPLEWRGCDPEELLWGLPVAAPEHATQPCTPGTPLAPQTLYVIREAAGSR